VTDYRYERYLVDDLVRAIPHVFATGSSCVRATEVTSGARVVDVVVAGAVDPVGKMCMDPGFGAAMLRLTQPQLTVLAMVWSRERVTLSTLSRATWTSAGDLLSAYVEPLMSLGLLEETRSRTYRPTSWAEWRPEHVTTIEAKLRDWQDVLSQAVDNRDRSDFSYIAIPEREAFGLGQGQSIEAFARRLGVGVVRVDEQAGSRVSLRPRRRATKPPLGRWILALQMLVGLLSDDGKWTIDEGIRDTFQPAALAV